MGAMVDGGSDCCALLRWLATCCRRATLCITAHACCCAARRAKRLKKLMRMMTSTTAQLASARFNRHTYVLTLILMAAHVVCFVVLLTQVNARYQ